MGAKLFGSHLGYNLKLIDLHVGMGRVQLLRQPAFVQLRRDRPEALRLASTMEGSDEIMTNTLFLGTYPGLTSDMLKAEIEVITSFVAKSFHAHRTA